MKTRIQILGAIALAASLAHGENADKPDRKGPPNPAKLHERLDTDGDGSVSLDEFKASPRGQQNPEKAEEIFGRIDADSDGGITVDEFAKHLAKARHHAQGGPNPKQVIERLDTDGNGTVSLDEFLAGKRAQENPEMARKLFAKIDADSDGEISVGEFARHHAQHHGAKPGPRDGKGPRPGAGKGPRDGGEDDPVVD